MVHPKFFIVFVLWMLAGTIGFAQGGKGMRGGVPFTYASELAPWTGANNQQVLMKLIGSSQGRAVFQKEDGKIVTSALQSLSEESRKRIEACEQKMREAGYTQRGGFWYSAEDLAALEKKMGESTPAGASLTQTTRVAPKPTMDCRVTITKTNKNPGEFSKSGTH